MLFSELTDEQLVELFLAGNEAAFEQIVLRHEQKVFQLAYRLSGNVDDASDLAQEAFLKAYRYLHQFRGQAAFSTWLYRIVTNSFLDEMRRRQRRPQIQFSLDDEIITDEGELTRQLPSPNMGPEEKIMQKEVQHYVQAALSDLPAKYRLVLTLRDIQGYTYEEIAQITGSKLGTVKSRISRARSAFRDLLQQQEQSSASVRQTIRKEG